MEAFHSRFKTENRSPFSDTESFADLERIVGQRMDYYNRRRRHSALGNQAPLVYLAGLKAGRRPHNLGVNAVQEMGRTAQFTAISGFIDKGDHAMKPSWRWPVLAGLMSLSGISVCSAATPFEMTGGGSVLQSGTAGRVTHGFEVHCGTTANPSSTNNSLEVDWGSAGNKHHFELSDVLISADCFYDPAVGSPNPPPAGFNTFIGDGTGTLDGHSGATIHFTFTDAGEPGGTNGTPPPDTAAFLIIDASGSVVLSVPTTALTFGNHQAHSQ